MPNCALIIPTSTAQGIARWLAKTMGKVDASLDAIGWGNLRYMFAGTERNLDYALTARIESARKRGLILFV